MLAFLYLKDLLSHNVDGIMKAVKSAFSIHNLHQVNLHQQLSTTKW